jgi:hypothetical protein
MPNTQKTNWIRLSSPTKTLTFHFASRDWKVLSQLSTSGDSSTSAWMEAFGFHPGGPEFSVARGLQIGYEVTGRRSAMLHSTELLLPRLAQEAEFLIYDYSVTASPGLRGEDPPRTMRGGSVSGLLHDGQSFTLSLGPGQCLLSETARPATGLRIDLRGQRTFALDETRILKIGRHKKGLAWLSVLPEVEEFLKSETSEEIAIFNHHR